MKRIDVVKKRDGWAGESGGHTVRNTKAPTKADAVKKVAAAAKKDPQPVSVRIHKANGQFPGGADLPALCGPAPQQGLAAHEQGAGTPPRVPARPRDYSP